MSDKKMKKIHYFVIAAIALVFVWTGSLAAQTSAYNSQVNNGVAYFRQRASEQLPLVQTLVSALRSGDLERAKTAYTNSRPPYEEIEVYAASFEKEDTDIDSRPYAIAGGETSPEYKGFHRIEALIYRDGDLNAAIPYGEELVASVKSLIGKLNDPQNFNAALNFKGMLSLANEVPSKKISSEEETWSDQSLLIFKHNWIGIHSQFTPYKIALNKDIATEVETAYQDCLKTVAPFFRSGEVAATPYSQVSVTDRAAIVRASYRYRDALLKAKTALKIPDVA